MKILIITNRLFPFGGAETYAFSIGEELKNMGHNVQYFGVYYNNPNYGNAYSIYAKKSKTPFQIIENKYNKKQFAKLLDAFEPDIIHINLIYFTLTPSILSEAKKRHIPIVQTVHDGKIVCPSYQLYISKNNEPCTRCKNGSFFNCIKFKCHKESLFLSFLAYLEARHNNKKGYYNLIDKFIFPSYFMKSLHEEFGIEKEKSVFLCNFSRLSDNKKEIIKKEKYILYFGRVTKVKGMDLLKRIILLMPDYLFVIAGHGDMMNEFKDLPNCNLVGHKDSDEIKEIVSKASCSIYPSQWLENCPLSVIESICLGTPVIASNIGGISDLVKNGFTGFLQKPNDVDGFIYSLKCIMDDENLASELSTNCLKEKTKFDRTIYTKRIIEEYKMLSYKK